MTPARPHTIRLFCGKVETKMEGAARQSKTKQQLEIELLDLMREKQVEWQHAPAEERDAARQRFMDALQVFNALVLYKKIP